MILFTCYVDGFLIEIFYRIPDNRLSVYTTLWRDHFATTTFAQPVLLRTFLSLPIL